MTDGQALALQGRTVVMTRAMEQQSEGRRLLEALGADVLDLPALEIGPPDPWGALDDALAEWDTFHWLIGSSAAAISRQTGDDDAASACCNCSGRCSASWCSSESPPTST